MKKETILETIKSYENWINQTACIAHNYIVVVNDVYTIDLDENRTPKLVMDLYPTQYSEKTAKQIIDSIKCQTILGEPVEAKIVSYRDWYRNKIENMKKLVGMVE